jgi:hypothetical protein
MLSETPVQQHPRIHLDLYADDQGAEVERLVALGRVWWTSTTAALILSGFGVSPV